MGRRSMEISDVVVVDDGQIRGDEAPTETTDPDEHTMSIEAVGAKRRPCCVRRSHGPSIKRKEHEGKMTRRRMETGGIVLIDARGVNALGIVEEISGDAEKPVAWGMPPKASGRIGYTYCVVPVMPMGRLCRRIRTSGSTMIHGMCGSMARMGMRCRSTSKVRMWQGCWRKPVWHAKA